jgi:hypothetical protein
MAHGDRAAIRAAHLIDVKPFCEPRYRPMAPIALHIPDAAFTEIEHDSPVSRRFG